MMDYDDDVLILQRDDGRTLTDVPFRDLDPMFRCAACGKPVHDVPYQSEKSNFIPNFLCGECRQKWNAK